MPAAQAPIATTASFTRNGQSFTGPGRIADRIGRRIPQQQSAECQGRYGVTPKHTLTARYLNNLQDSIATAQQATPQGQTLLNDQNQHGTNVWLTSVLSLRMTNEVRVAHQHLGNISRSGGSGRAQIPSIEISELGCGVQRSSEPHGAGDCREHPAVPLQRHVSFPEHVHLSCPETTR